MANNNDCIFCKIVSGKIPCYKIYEDKETLAFLDAFPQMKGQVLLIPKQHISPYMFNIDDKIYCSLLLTAKKIAKAIDKSLKPLKTGLVIEGLEVEHIHIKLYPLTKQGFNYKLTEKPSEQEMKEIAESIKKAL
ncbi:HIT family protein [Candidatus Pacearchaeota archaeon CG_4_9_14_3_um_filter_31_7]|nr:MAG: hypothetical protein AUJ10_00560 [Candidatus Pacearchaeota archaeon CG1_02_31_27]PJA70963.1 MAG: HIT family protein [Candidatus Pacearchaeota archaeon CG_4_9_14_3_um_filter_31_7]